MRKEKSKRENQSHRVPMLELFKQYLAHHRHCFFQSLQKLWRTPLASTMTLCVIGIALAFPTGLYIVLNNAKALTGAWDGPMEISLFLKTQTTSFETSNLSQRLASYNEILKTHIIDKQAALESFASDQQIYQVLSNLPQNPLPNVIVVTPKPTLSAIQLAQLQQELAKLEQVDIAEFDLAWLQKLSALLALGKQSTTLLAVLLGVAVIVISGNTIRLTIERHRPEIEITRLIGATNGFIRRPFLYLGLWFGIIGGLLACAITFGSVWILNHSVAELAKLYQSDFILSGLSLRQSAILLGFSLLLGLTGAFLAVSRHLVNTGNPR